MAIVDYRVTSIPNPVNRELLDAELHAGIASYRGASLRVRDGAILAAVLHFEDGTQADFTAADAILAAHDGTAKTDAQQAAEAAEAARAAVVQAAADALLAQIATGLTANASDQSQLDSITTVAHTRVAIGRLLQREAAIMGALEKIVTYLKATA